MGCCRTSEGRPPPDRGPRSPSGPEVGDQRDGEHLAAAQRGEGEDSAWSHGVPLWVVWSARASPIRRTRGAEIDIRSGNRHPLGKKRQQLVRIRTDDAETAGYGLELSSVSQSEAATMKERDLGSRGCAPV